MKYIIERVNPLEARIRDLSGEQVCKLSGELRRRLAEGQSRNDVKAEAFALVREAPRQKPPPVRRAACGRHGVKDGRDRAGPPGFFDAAAPANRRKSRVSLVTKVRCK